MKNKKTVKVAIVSTILLISMIWLLSNRTDNVFEEIYYSEFPSVFKEGLTSTSLSHIKGCYRADKALENDLGGNIIIYNINAGSPRRSCIEIENGIISIWLMIEKKDYNVTLYYQYILNEKKVYIKCYFESMDTGEEVTNSEEILPQFLEEQGINATTMEEVRDIMLEDFLTKWFEGNPMSKFSMDDLGDFEIVYE